MTVKSGGVNDDNVTPIDQLCIISPRPVFLIYGGQDNLAKNGTVEEMSSAACEPYEFRIIEEAGHQNFAPLVEEEYRTRIPAFFDAVFN